MMGLPGIAVNPVFNSLETHSTHPSACRLSVRINILQRASATSVVQLGVNDDLEPAAQICRSPMVGRFSPRRHPDGPPVMAEK